MKTKKHLLDILWIVIIAVAATTLMMILCKASPLEAYQMFFNGIFGNLSSFCEVFVKATPLILTGLGCAVAFRT